MSLTDLSVPCAPVNSLPGDAGRPALDTVVQAMGGLMDLTRVDGVPTKPGISASDMLGGQMSPLATLAALECQSAGNLDPKCGSMFHAEHSGIGPVRPDRRRSVS